MNIVHLFSDIAIQHGRKTAIIENGQLVSYQDLWNTVEQLSFAFYEIGIREHHRVALILPNSSEFIYCFFALLKNNAIVSPLNPDFTSSELKSIFHNLEPHAIIATSESVKKVTNEIPSLIEQKTLIVQGSEFQTPPADKYYELGVLLQQQRQRIDISREAESTATINYTYRGLGYPLGAMLSHENYLKGISGYIDRTKMGSRHRVLSILPLHHVFPLLGCMLAPLFSGATIVISRNYLPRAILKTIDDHKINYLTMVPLIYKLLLRYYKKEDYNLGSLTCCVTGGDYISASFQEEFYDKLGITLLQGYGLTECLPIICNPPLKNKFGSLGTSGRDDITIKIVDEGGYPKETGGIGEIFINSPTVMSGYFRMDDETRMVLSDGWLRTGDYGYLDDDGYLYFTGRRKKVAKVGGNVVDLKEVQCVLLSHPMISDASIHAIEDELWGHHIKAEVVLRRTDKLTLTESDILTYCRKRLTGFKIPKKIEVPVEVG